MNYYHLNLSPPIFQYNLPISTLKILDIATAISAFFTLILKIRFRIYYAIFKHNWNYRIRNNETKPTSASRENKKLTLGK